MTADARPPALPLTPGQRARRVRILDATAELAGRGGFEAVQMREVAEAAGVALGTLYRYFPSKSHLLVATLHDRLRLLRTTLADRPPAGETAGERAAATLLRAFGALRREPELADAMLRALTSADRSVSTEVDAVSLLVTEIVLDAAGWPEPDAGQASAVRVVEHTWHATLTCWLSGRAPAAQVRTDIETVCRLLDPPATGP
ncbi:TetR family transcriptional regulator [Streptomyces sp. NBC_01218]|uniref:TetR family transcriptional regulator n=1 Tax=unclassified Streptomyces TaxID=2593676 RepID=UPI0023B91EC4|nr:MULTISPECIES: TetR family transcriptional regulator [unclassified Streptomyces]WEH42089.1 TetR family transcriptional regulator [Streptomyces sp. AM 2-1-1]WSQ53711.1 TetR family transcriptional regulator [Streptomyces sp. NBC_01218]